MTKNEMIKYAFATKLAKTGLAKAASTAWKKRILDGTMRLKDKARLDDAGLSVGNSVINKLKELVGRGTTAVRGAAGSAANTIGSAAHTVSEAARPYAGIGAGAAAGGLGGYLASDDETATRNAILGALLGAGIGYGAQRGAGAVSDMADARLRNVSGLQRTGLTAGHAFDPTTSESILRALTSPYGAAGVAGATGAGLGASL